MECFQPNLISQHDNLSNSQRETELGAIQVADCFQFNGFQQNGRRLRCSESSKEAEVKANALIMTYSDEPLKAGLFIFV
ncbi:hypothetical protein CEXT_271491 [Caerostris extrusa]|uniref:Uncharacterized protein n=1 Tax=Caerostris extrusa TaxID=172846 RepID=A0AAV4PSA9_CAEEX|nr:hypothetical protein CEXT_271491 [Caerostris extrusa]